MDPEHTPSSTLSPSSHQSPSNLPPEAITLASRFFHAARTGDSQSHNLLSTALSHGGTNLSNLTNDKGDTLLMLAAYHGNVDVVRLLVGYGADVNRVNDRGQSPLAGCVFKMNGECVEVLIGAGADPELGMPSAIECCRMFKQEGYIEMFERQIERLRGEGRSAVNGNGTGHLVGMGSGGMNGASGMNGGNSHA